MRDDSYPPHRAAGYGDSAKRRTVMDGATGHQRSVRPAARPRVLDVTPPRGTRVYRPNRDDDATTSGDY